MTGTSSSRISSISSRANRFDTWPHTHTYTQRHVTDPVEQSSLLRPQRNTQHPSPNTIIRITRDTALRRTYRSRSFWTLLANIANVHTAYLARAENVVDILEKSFVLYFVVTKYKRNSLALATGGSIEKLQIFNEVRHVVRSNAKTPASQASVMTCELVKTHPLRQIAHPLQAFLPKQNFQYFLRRNRWETNQLYTSRNALKFTYSKIEF